MAFFANSSGFNISGGEFSNVARDQHNTRHQTTSHVTDSYNTHTTTNYDSYNRTYQHRQDNRDNRQFVNGNYQDRREWAQTSRNDGYAAGKAYRETMVQEQARIAMQQGVPSLPPSHARHQRPQNQRPQKQQRREPLPALPPIPPVARFNEEHPPQGGLSPQDKLDSDRILASLQTKQHPHRATPDSRSAAYSRSNSQRNGNEGELMRKELEEPRSQQEYDRIVANRQSNDSRNDPSSRITSQRNGNEGNLKQKEAEEASRSPSSSEKPPIIAGGKEVGVSAPEAPVPPPRVQVEHAASVHPSIDSHSPHHAVDSGDRLVSENEDQRTSTSSQPTSATENVRTEADRVDPPEEQKSRFRRLHRWMPWAWKSS